MRRFHYSSAHVGRFTRVCPAAARAGTLSGFAGRVSAMQERSSPEIRIYAQSHMHPGKEWSTEYNRTVVNVDFLC